MGEVAYRERALAALEAEEAERAAIRAENERRMEEAEQKRRDKELTLAAKSRLGEWFPEATWEWVGRVDDGVVVRTEGLDLLFVVIPNNAGAKMPSHYRVKVCREGATRMWLDGTSLVQSLADLGRVIRDRERPAPEPSS